MTIPSSCPSAERLRQLLSPEPPTPEHAALRTHLDSCAPCQRKLEELTSVTKDRLGSAAHPGNGDAPTPLQPGPDDLGSAGNPTLPYRRRDPSAWLHLLLRPSPLPDALGRLEGYEVIEVIGRGGMGLVFKAFDPALKRWVAIKALAPDLAADRVARQRFAREARAAAAVRHAHVITIHAVSETAGLPFLVMEFAAGGSLHDYLNRHGPLDWRAATRLGAEIADGLAAAHAQGLVHRDIKPSNILLQTEGPSEELGVATICDFGLARVGDESRLTQTGIVTGTPMYMSPEQAMGEALDGRADLFSLGSVLYTVCTGREPWAADSPMAVLRRVCEDKAQPVREINPAIPTWLAETIERLHAKRRADRFASAAELAELLRYNLEHPDFPRQAPRPRRRGRRLALVAVLLGLLLASGVFLSEALHWTHLAGWWATAEVPDNRVQLRAILRGHNGPVWSVAFAPDGRMLATGSDDSTLRLWDARTGREEAVLPGQSGAVLGVAFAHSGKFLVTGESDGILRVWDVATRKESAILPHGSGNVRRVAISPDDRTVAVGSSARGVELWDLQSRKVRQNLSEHQGTILAIAFAPDGKTLATGDASGRIRLWDPDTGAERANFRGDPLGLRALAFSPDSQLLASSGSGDKDVKLWNVSTLQPHATLAGYETGVSNVAISADGRLLATGSRDGIVKIWDVPAARLLTTLQAHQGFVWGLAFSPDNRTLATVGEDRLGKLWDLDQLSDARP